MKKIKPDGSKTIYVGQICEVDKTSGGAVTKITGNYPAGGATPALGASAGVCVSRYKISVVTMCLCLSVLFATLVCVLSNSAGGGNGLAPARSLTLTIAKNQREVFFDQLRKFADENAFETRLTDFNTNGESFQFWMSREDVFITASDVPPDPTLVYIFLTIYPGSSIDEETIDELINDLKNHISEIPNVTIEEK